MKKSQNKDNAPHSDDFYISDEPEEITSSQGTRVESDSPYANLIEDINQTVLGSDIDPKNQTLEHEAGSIYNDDSTMTDEELQKILSVSNVSIEENPSLDELTGDELTGDVEPGDETITSLNPHIETESWDEEHDHIASSSVENIVQNILGENGDQEEESQTQDYVESINSDENNYSSTITELTTIVEGVEPGNNLFPNPLSEEKHEEIVARIESLWADLAYVWPSIQKQPQVVAKIEELWNILKQDDNETYVLPSEFEQLFQETDTSSNDNILDLSDYRSQTDQAYSSSKLTNSDTADESILDETHKHLFKNGKLQATFNPTIVDDKLGDLVSSILGENTDSNESSFLTGEETDWSAPVTDESDNHLFESVDIGTTGSETTTNNFPVDIELGDLVSNILGENTESDEPRFDETRLTTETNWLAKITSETDISESVTNGSENYQTDNKMSETAINASSYKDEVSELVSNLLGENTDSVEIPHQMGNATYANTSDNDTTNVVDDILKKYAQEEDNQSEINTKLDTQNSDTTPIHDKFVVDEELQNILESTTGSNATVSDTKATSAVEQTAPLKEAETESRPASRTTPTLRDSAIKSKHSTTTQSNKSSLGKVHVNVTSEPDNPSSGWKWALASLVPIAIIAMVWTYLRSDDEITQLATTADNMALYASKRESVSTNTRDNTTREETIEDIIKRMSETDTASSMETTTFDEFNSVIEPAVVEPEATPEYAQTEFASEEIEPLPFNQASSEISPVGISSETVGTSSETIDSMPMNPGMTSDEFTSSEMASPAVGPSTGISPNNEQHLQGLTDHISRLEATIADLQQTAATQNAAVMQAQETANTLPVEKITQLIDVPVANLQQGVDQRFMNLGARIFKLESAVKELQQSTQLSRQKATSENNANAVLSQGNQQQINTLTQRLSEIESSLQDQAAKISSNESAQALQQKELQHKILNGNKAVANEASIALSQGNQQQIQSLSHRIKKVESSLQKHATDISHNKIMVGNTASTEADNDVNTRADAGHVLIEKDNSGVTITLNKPLTAAGKQANDNNKYRTVTHIVVKNDTLWSIAKRYVKNPYLYHELARLSNIKNPDLIYPGNRVRIVQFID